jgi:hypothetical protein
MHAVCMHACLYRVCVRACRLHARMPHSEVCVHAILHACAIRNRARLCFVPLSLHQHRGMRACYTARTRNTQQSTPLFRTPLPPSASRYACMLYCTHARYATEHACRTHARTRTVIPHSDVCAGGARVIYRGRNSARLSYARMHACPHRRLQPHSINVLLARYCPNRARHRLRWRWQP